MNVEVLHFARACRGLPEPGHGLPEPARGLPETWGGRWRSDFSFQEKYQYSHNYEKGDLVIWDNRCTMHKANSDYDTSQLRVMHRVMLEGEKVF